MSWRRELGAIVAVLVVAGACAREQPRTRDAARSPTTSAAGTTAMPATATDVYGHTRPGDLSPAVAGVPARVYVPNSDSNTVDVIDPASARVVAHFPVGALPQHVTPSWDLRTLYVDNDQGNSLTPIDPRTVQVGQPIPVADPYNLYFTPDGTKAIVVAERLRRLDFRDPHTWRLLASVPVPYPGVDHADFSADGSFMLVSCEFSGWLVRVDVHAMAVTGQVHVGGKPIDVKLAPDGSRFYVTDQQRGGVLVIDASTLRETRFIPTGAGAHGLYPSRDGRQLYVSNRTAGSVSVLDFRTGHLLDTWRIGGSPDMGGVSADGRVLWLSGRYDGVVYAIDTASGRLLHTIRVGSGPHGLAVFPQPGRYSLGHTGVFR